MKRRGATWGAIILLAGASPAYGHAVTVYLSTPFSAPAGFEWVTCLAVGALFLVNALLLRRFRLRQL